MYPADLDIGIVLLLLLEQASSAPPNQTLCDLKFGETLQLFPSDFRISVGKLPLKFPCHRTQSPAVVPIMI
jgi:hypothetical protein